MSETLRIKTPRCDALLCNAMDSNDIRAWRSLAVELETTVTAANQLRVDECAQLLRAAGMGNKLSGKTLVGMTREACEAIAAATAEAERMKRDALAAFPTNWCDPLLSGKGAALKSPLWGCPDIERLLAAIKKRVADALSERADKGK